MKNLYIYKVYSTGELIKTTWEDVKVTKKDGIIVTKKDSRYRLEHGTYKYLEDLEKVRVFENSQGVAITVYITFSKELTQEIKKQLITPFIKEIENKIKVLQADKENFFRRVEKCRIKDIKYN